MDVAELAAKLEQLEAKVDDLATERDKYKELYQGMLKQNRKLELGLLGQKAKRLPQDESQLALQVLGTLLQHSDVEPPAKEEVRSHERRKPTGRKPLPENLPRVVIELVPPEVETQGRDNFEVVGTEVSETIERRPQSVVVLRIERLKFLRKDRDRAADVIFWMAEPFDLPIPRGLAGPGLLADTIVRRWQDHMPLHRLEKMYRREGLELARSTMCGWHGRLAELVKPVVDAMWKMLAALRALCVDATGVLVQAKHRCKTGHFWVAVAPGRHVLYAYSQKHDGKAVDKLLGDYEGFVVADAHSVYDHLYNDGNAIEVGCWAHTRRYFVKALESEPELARQALALIQVLLRFEREFAALTPKKRQRARREHSKPIVDRFFDWCHSHAAGALAATPLKAGITYALNQADALKRFLDDGRLPIHNNISELHLRRQAVGRNYVQRAVMLSTPRGAGGGASSRPPACTPSLRRSA